MTIHRVLVLKQDGLRHFVEAEPAFAAIREAHPRAHIDLITTQAFGRLAKGSPYFDRVLAAGAFEEKGAQKQFFSQLKRMGYGLVYDLDGTRETLDIRAALTGFRGPRWVGPKKVMSRPGREVGFAGPAMRKLLSDAGLPVTHRLPDLSFATEGRKDAANMQPSWFGISGPFALMIPAFVEERRWPAGAWAELAGIVAQAGVVPVLLGHETLTPFAHQVGHAMARLRLPANALVDLTGKADLAQIAMLAKRASFFVSNTAEELHLAASVGCPGVVILHPADAAAVESLFGRRIVKLVAERIEALDPLLAADMLRSMGLIGEARAVRAAFA
jgi:ADP-heptose:LPS heptosyltransferase